MARADLLKKLFSSFKIEDREAFLRVAEEIIEDERKKNHGILANELKTIISTGTSFPKRSLSAFSASESKTKDHEETLFEIRYPEKTLSDVVLTSENRQQIEQIIREFLNWDVLMSNGVYPLGVSFSMARLVAEKLSQQAPLLLKLDCHSYMCDLMLLFRPI